MPFDNHSDDPDDPRLSVERFQFALQAAQVGTWDLDIPNQRVWWDERCKQLYGYSRQDTVPYEEVLAYAHPEDRARVDQAVEWALNPQSGGHYDLRFRTLGAEDGKLRWLHCQGRAYFDGQGVAYRFSGIAQDVTPLVRTHQQLDRSEARFENLVMTSPAATAVFVGRDMLIEQVNPPMLAIWGKDESVIGKPLHLALPEGEGQPLLAQLQHTFDTGESFQHPQSVAELIEDGKPKRVYVNYAYNPLYDKDGQIYGVINTATDVTAQVVARQQLSDSHRFSDNLFNNTVAAQSVMLGEQMRLSQVNDKMLELWGRDRSIVGKPLMDALPELVGTPLTQRLRHVYTTGEPYHQPEERFDLLRYGQPHIGYYRYTYEPLYSSQNQIYGVICTTVEITQEVLARQKAQDSEARFRALVEQAPVATCLFVGRDLRIEVANEAMIQVWGKGPGVTGRPLGEALPELNDQHFLVTLNTLLTTGESFSAKGGRADLVVEGKRQTFYFDYDFKPLRQADGTVYAILQTAIDVTAQVLAQQQLEEKSRGLELALAIGQLGTFQVRLSDQMARYSPRVGDWFDLPDEPQPLRSIFARIHAEDQSGAVAAIEGSIAGEQGGYHDLTYRLVNPTDGRLRYLHSMGQVRWEAGLPVAIDGILQEVTQEVLGRQALEEREAALRNAIELAELGNFSVDVATQVITVSPRVADWFGLEGLTANAETFIGGVGESDRDHVRTSLYNTLLAGSDGRYDVVHSVIHAQTGRPTILHALGQVYRNATGQPMRIEGTAQDITRQRELQLVLAQQVQQRTEELAAINEELRAANDELATTNREYADLTGQLQEANGLLKRSNENLQTFAYIASHDLQEPLRKIQQFGDLLKTRFADSTGEELAYLERMQSAASRMSVLIKDLLNYSRISTQPNASAPVSLDAVVAGVLTTLEWTIRETGAQIQVDSLPTLPGDATQLGQLFQNLLSNALKFRRPNTVPMIQVRTQPVAAADLPASVQPSRVAGQYYRIEVADNGVGFEEKYLDRIFQVFQRLHGKNEFAGTGIELAICEKVVTNHGGAITASSQPGQGATFSVYLPI